MVTILYDAKGDIEFDLSENHYVALFLCQNCDATRVENCLLSHTPQHAFWKSLKLTCIKNAPGAQNFPGYFTLNKRLALSGHFKGQEQVSLWFLRS